MEVILHVYGLPAPKGSTTKMPNGAYLQGSSKTGRDKYKNWVNLIGVEVDRLNIHGLIFAKGVPVCADIQLWLPRAKSNKSLFPVCKPDGDKLERTLLDPLSGRVYHDDAQIIDCHWSKCWATENSPSGALLKFWEYKM